MMSQEWQRTPVPVTYDEERALVGYIAQTVEDRLAGRHEYRVVNRPPVDQCFLGVLFPTSHQVDYSDGAEAFDPSDDDSVSASDENTASEASVREPGRLEAPPQESNTRGPTATEALDSNDARRRPPSSLGCEILLQPHHDRIELELVVQLAVYTRHLPTFQEQSARYDSGQQRAGTGDSATSDMTLLEVTERHDLTVPLHVSFPSRGVGRITDQGRLQRELESVLNEACSRPDILREWPSERPKVPAPALRSEDEFWEWLRDKAQRTEVCRPPLRAHLEIRYQTLSDGHLRIGCYVCNDTVQDRDKRTLDQYHILGDVRLTVEVPDGPLLPVEILPVPDDYQYDRRVWAVGHNTSVFVNPAHTTVQTQALARYEQPRQTTKNEPAARFEDLETNPMETLEAIRIAMENAARHWESDVLGADGPYQSDREVFEACQKDYRAFRDEIDRFAAGMAALSADPRLLTAFKSMNKVMRRLASGYDAWRLFQVAFIVTQLPALAVRENVVKGAWPDDHMRNWSDILDCADVLWFPTGGGKTEAYLGLIACGALYDRLRGKQLGITAWLRFPLRMLSLQQLQRAMRVIWETEKERQTLLGDNASQSDPIQLGYLVGSTPNQLSAETFRQYRDPEDCEDLRLIPDCPACGTVGAVQVYPDEDNLRFYHRCTHCKAELPLMVTDGEIYRLLPSLVVGTVDKMATVGFQPRFGMLWAGPRWQCPQHGYGLGKFCVWGCQIPAARRRRITPYDPSPALHIQDELHLLQEELGAFAGHYETLVRYCEEGSAGRPAKVVAATATIEGFAHQTRHLYGVKTARRFPGRGYQRYKSFYAELDENQPGEAKVNRLFLAFRPPNLHPADAAAKCTQILLDTVAGLMANPYAAAVAMGLKDPQRVMDLLYYYITTLTYVSSLPSGSRVKERLESVAPAHLRHGRELNVAYTNGRSSAAEVAEAVHRIDHPPEWGQSGFLDSLVATNMISHGVDLERINLMVMDGFPESTAEYIQASSRSGRRHMGLVLVTIPGYSLRGNSLYQRFQEYHANLDRMVTPVPVNRFAKYAVKRTLPGILSGLIFGKYVPERNQSDLGKRAMARELIQSEGDRLITHLRGAYALGDGLFEEGLESALHQALMDEFEQIRYQIQTNELEASLTDAMRPRPMSNLRDVERGVPFRPESYDPRDLIWFQTHREG